MKKITKSLILSLFVVLLLLPQYIEMISHGIAINTKLAQLLLFDYKLFLYNLFIFSTIPLLFIVILFSILITNRILNDNNRNRIYDDITLAVIIIFSISFVLSFFLSSTPDQFSFFMTVVAFISILITTSGKIYQQFH